MQQNLELKSIFRKETKKVVKFQIFQDCEFFSFWESSIVEKRNFVFSFSIQKYREKIILAEKNERKKETISKMIKISSQVSLKNLHLKGKFSYIISESLPSPRWTSWPLETERAGWWLRTLKTGDEFAGPARSWPA